MKLLLLLLFGVVSNRPTEALNSDCSGPLKKFCAVDRYCRMFRADVLERCQRDCDACLDVPLPGSTATSPTSAAPTREMKPAPTTAPFGRQTSAPAPAQCDRPPNQQTTQVWDRVSELNKALTRDLNAFAWSLFKQARAASPDGNVFVSPTSIALALAMVQAGANNNTLAQIDKAFTPSLAQNNEKYAAFKQLMDSVNGPNQGYQLSTANAIYAQKDMPMLKEYMRVVTKCLQSEASMVDFITNFEGIRQRINSWVEDKTNDKIIQLLAPGVLNSAARMVLVNAIYFKGEWLTPFDQENGGNTYDGTFNPTPTTSQEVKFMSREGRYAYYEDGSVQVLGIPYKGNDLAMYVVLPKPSGTLSSINIDAANVQKWISKAKGTSVKVDVHMPKFKMTRELDLKTLLQQLGMTDMFAGGAADFSRITGDKSLFVSKAIHKAFIEVNEKGTEAAAATAFILSRTAFIQEKIIFRANRPFLFVINHEILDIPLFTGTLTLIE